MTFRNMMMMISMTLLIGASACSTTSSAQSEAPAESAEQTQASTHEHAEHKLEGKPAEADPTKESHSMAEICPMHVEGTTRDLVQLDGADRKSTRLNSSHVRISYAVFCLKKKKKKKTTE